MSVASCNRPQKAPVSVDSEKYVHDNGTRFGTGDLSQISPEVPAGIYGCMPCGKVYIPPSHGSLPGLPGYACMARGHVRKR
jgi:hypothetical protein|tara:strand:+ start:787 stop:1029 length:243 start_codon:yes stop_codon:yes gene_type:complete